LASDIWHRAILAMRLVAIDPGLGGAVLRARAGPVRDVLLGCLPWLAQPCHRLHPAITDEALFGGLDLSATLAKGQMVLEQGLLSRPGTLILTMAERATPTLAARLAMALDDRRGTCLIALDEGAAEDEAIDPKLAERLAFHVDLTDVPLAQATPPAPFDPASAKARLADVQIPDAFANDLAQLAAQCGIDSLRAPLLALRAARAHAALHDKPLADADDLRIAAMLVFAHRATQIPAEDDSDTPPPPDDDTQDDTGGETEDTTLPDELVLEAIRALLPDDLLDRINLQKARNAKGSGSGATRKGNRRGRPLPARAGKLGGDARLDLVATLRAAAPWQTIRRQATGRDGLHIRADDFRLKRAEEKSDRLLVFTVDASGSSALTRLAEAKGAIEILLAAAYARRDHVALISFRGTAAEVLLPPTRSLVQTKRRLAALPGGGGTPLAAGLMAALTEAQAAGRKGLTPTLVVLTDGRANVALDGQGNRAQAASDALRIGRMLRAAGMAAMIIDTGNRPEPALAQLAAEAGAIYLPLPRADAARLSQSVAAAMAG
jgi:magnesium chelatase subunit D